MIDENQETEDDYLQLEQFIEEVEADRATQLPADLTPKQRRIYRTAAFFCSLFPHTAEPRPEFVEALRVRLLAMVKESTDMQLRLAHRAAVSRRTRPRRTRGVRHHRPSSRS